MTQYPHKEKTKSDLATESKKKRKKLLDLIRKRRAINGKRATKG